MNDVFVHPICQKSLDVAMEWLNVVDELEKTKARVAYLKNVIAKSQVELAKEYGVGYITRKSVKKNRFPVFRSIEKGKDYNLERNFPDLANVVNEYFDIRERIKTLEKKRKQLDSFLNNIYTTCVPYEIRDPRRAYKARKEMKSLAFVSRIEDDLEERCEDGDKEACNKLSELLECVKKGFYVEGKRIVCE